MRGEREKRTPMNRNITINKALKNGGYYDINGNWNALISFTDKPGLIFRDRVEVLILNKNNAIYMVNYKNGTYRLPGGGVENGRGYKYQVAQESKEEAGILLGRIYNVDISYFRYFSNDYGTCPIHWNGTYSRVYVAHFKDWYYGKVKSSVMDTEMMQKGRFVPYKQAISILSESHRMALSNYFKMINKE